MVLFTKNEIIIKIRYYSYIYIYIIFACKMAGSNVNNFCMQGVCIINYHTSLRAVDSSN